MNFIPLASPDIRSEDISAVNEVLLSGNLVQGKNVQLLENRISEFVKVPYCVLVTNGTATLHLTLLALEIGHGDEVIVPAFSYIASANVVELVGAKTVFVDIEIDTYNINLNQIKSKITPRTKAVIVVHEFGLCANIRQIHELCIEHNLNLIEDAACALGSYEENCHAGSFGVAGSFSFHPRKAITSGEGGAIVTHNENLAKKLRALRNHGIDSNNQNEMDFILPGYNCRLTDIQAALLLSQFNRIESTLSRKKSIANRYLKEINNSKITLPYVPPNKTPSWQTFHVILSENLDRNIVISEFRQKGIGVNYGAQCIPEQTYFKNKYNLDSEIEFPNSLKAYKKGLAIPLYEKLENYQIDYIIESLNKL